MGHTGTLRARRSMASPVGSNSSTVLTSTAPVSYPRGICRP
uniref:Uncharacterized protein n=1 Tax=Arundo donax TaxID=35708 RepID=A0A0A9FAV5_ARUDO